MESATCIVALIDNGTIWMGGDSASIETGTADVYMLTNKKVFKRRDRDKNQFLFDFTGQYRLGQILQHIFVIPPIPENDKRDVLRYMVKDFIPCLQQCFRDTGYEHRENGRSAFNGSFLVSVADRVFKVGQQYSVHEAAQPYTSLGCRGSFALGSFYSTAILAPGKRVRLALETAELFSGGVQRPFTIIKT